MSTEAVYYFKKCLGQSCLPHKIEWHCQGKVGNQNYEDFSFYVGLVWCLFFVCLFVYLSFFFFVWFGFALNLDVFLTGIHDID